MKPAAAFVCCLLWVWLHAQVPDVQHYQFDIELSDRSDSIKGLATIRFKMAQEGSELIFDLTGIRNGKGMLVRGIETGGKAVRFTHRQDQLLLHFDTLLPAGAEKEISIRYAGIPSDGLIISKNMYGDRTFFSDNWPNRAHQWIPCNDRPDDKASVAFAVTAPVQYQVVSNGLLMEETNLASDLKKTVWKEDIPIPTKVMVIGAAKMAVGFLDTAVGVPVYAWVYPQDRDKGFKDYRLTKDMLQFFQSYIGPYAFKKLANVQSKTIFGGMENASAIFYAETSVTGDGKNEDLMAHEVAHQWFGNMVSEKSFAHLWLSEGFATYLTNVYLEWKYGQRRLQDRLSDERQAVLDFYRKSKSSVVNETPDLMSLLNANSYQKGSWILHMLRREVGDAAFQQILQAYYIRYRGSNADSKDFQQVAESVSGKGLESFFTQWLYQSGFPRIRAKWKYSNGSVQIAVQQTGTEQFAFPLEIALVDGRGNQILHRIVVNKIKDSFSLPASQKPTVILLDPNVNLLFEGTITE